MSTHVTPLTFASRGRAVIKYFGQLCLVVALLSLVPLLVSLALSDYDSALRYACVLAVLLAAGAVFARLQGPHQIQKNEAMVVTCLMFLATPLLMTFPLMSPGLDFPNALFESVSATTTTGLTMVTNTSEMPSTFLFARAWMQWYGGLGIVILSVAFVLQPGPVARRMAVTATNEDGLVGGMRAYARRAMFVYAILTTIGCVVLVTVRTQPFEAVLFTLAAVSTGGFAPVEGSLMGLTPAGQLTIMLLCLAGSTSFVFYLRFEREGFRQLLHDLQIRGVVALGVLAALASAVIAWPRAPSHLGESLWNGILMSVSAQTTSGFSSTSVSDVNPGTKLIWIMCMLVGGGAGSTAGGFKISRLLIAIRLFQVSVARICLPDHAVLEPRLQQKRIEASEIQNALLLILMFIAVLLLSWLPFLLFGYDPLDSLFEVASATGTVGLSSGITGPEMPGLLKGVLCVDMILGRLEIVPVLVLLYPRTWFGRKRAYP